MKIQIRKGLFETNSSSTHAIAIQSYPNMLYVQSLTDEELNKIYKDENIKKIKYPEKVKFNFGCFGWEQTTIKDVETKASYLYTAMMSNLAFDEFDGAIKRIKRWLNEEGIDCELQPYKSVEKDYFSAYWTSKFNVEPKDDEFYYIDHSDETMEFVCHVIATKNHLFNFLFGDSIIMTGNDNEESDIDTSKHISKDIGHIHFYKGN